MKAPRGDGMGLCLASGGGDEVILHRDYTYGSAGVLHRTAHAWTDVSAWDTGKSWRKSAIDCTDRLDTA